jgi:hypothetical protein
VFLAAWIEDSNPARHQQRRQRYILRNDEVAGDGMRGDVLVGDIGSAVNPDGAHERIARRCLEPLVGDQNGLDVQPFGRSEHELLHVPRGSVCVDPDSHRTIACSSAR